MAAMRTHYDEAGLVPRRGMSQDRRDFFATGIDFTCQAAQVIRPKGFVDFSQRCSRGFVVLLTRRLFINETGAGLDEPGRMHDHVYGEDRCTCCPCNLHRLAERPPCGRTTVERDENSLVHNRPQGPCLLPSNKIIAHQHRSFQSVCSVALRA